MVSTMKKLLFALILALTVVSVNAKEKEGKSATDADNTASVVVSGTISDMNSGESLVGVEVKIEGTDLKTYTDFDGNFAFKGVKSGEYKVVTNYISYKTTTQTLNTTKNEKDVKIKLQASN
jgi:hypothetical protein